MLIAGPVDAATPGPPALQKAQAKPAAPQKKRGGPLRGKLEKLECK